MDAANTNKTILSCLMMNVEQWTSYATVKENETSPRKIIAGSKFQTTPRKSPEIEMPRNSRRSRSAPNTKNNLLNTIANYVALVGLAFSLGIQVTTGLIQDASESGSGGFGDLADLVGANRIQWIWRISWGEYPYVDNQHSTVRGRGDGYQQFIA
jgi:hypothetical protein